MLIVQVVRWWSRLERQSCMWEVVGSSPTMDKNFSFCNSSRASNEIKRDIHLSNTLFEQGNCLHLLFYFSLRIMKEKDETLFSI